MNGRIKVIAGLYNRPALWLFLSGILYSFAFFGSFSFIFVYAGLFLFQYCFYNSAVIAKPFRYSFLFFWGFYLVLYTWFAELYPFEGFDLTKTQGMAIVLIAIFGISLLHSLETAFFFWFMRFLPKNKWLLPINTAVLMMLSQWFMSLGPLGFSWGTPAVAMYRFLPLIQNVSLLGAYFITLIVVCASGYFALFLLYSGKKLLAVGALCLVIPLISGTIMLHLPHKKSQPIKSAIIQGNILSMDKWEQDSAESHLNLYLDLAEQAAQEGAKLIVLPESAIPIVYTEGGIIYRSFSQLAQRYDCTFVLGVLTKNQSYRYNSMLMIYPDGSTSDYYHKRHLVPFGEAIPYRAFFDKFLPFFNNINLDKNEYLPGDGSQLFPFGDINVGGLICYDSIFAPLSRQSVNDGANLMVVCTNDSWYNDSVAVYQHLAHSVLRAVENGTPLIRAANTGVSCFIDGKGRIIAETAPLTKTVTSAEVYPAQSTTLYSIVGDVILYAAMLYGVLALIINLINTRYRNGKNQAL